VLIIGVAKKLAAPFFLPLLVREKIMESLNRVLERPDVKHYITKLKQETRRRALVAYFYKLLMFQGSHGWSWSFHQRALERANKNGFKLSEVGFTLLSAFVLSEKAWQTDGLVRPSDVNKIILNGQFGANRIQRGVTELTRENFIIRVQLTKAARISAKGRNNLKKHSTVRSNTYLITGKANDAINFYSQSIAILVGNFLQANPEFRPDIVKAFYRVVFNYTHLANKDLHMQSKLERIMLKHTGRLIDASDLDD
jgi:hypothetical protein